MRVHMGLLMIMRANEYNNVMFVEGSAAVSPCHSVQKTLTTIVI